MRADLKLMPFQVAGTVKLADARRAFLVWDPGVGKTPTAVRACVKTGARRVLVFCPPIATTVWRRHFEDWSNYQDIRVMNASFAVRPYQFIEGRGVRIIPYSRAKPDSAIMRAARAEIDGVWDVVVLDEGHYLKNSNAQRTRALYGTWTDLKGTPLEHAGQVWVLTGTPILNHPAEFWTHLHALAPETIVFSSSMPTMTEGFFTDRFCVTRPTPYGVRIMGGKNGAELAQRIRPVVDRKRLLDVVKDMPELRIVEHALPADTKIDPALRNVMGEALAKLGDLDLLDDDDLLKMVQSEGVAFSTVRRLIGRAKVAPSAEMIADMLDDGADDKVIVFCHHREVIRDLAVLLKRFNPLIITGATTPPMRDAAIDAFQKDPLFRLIVLAIDAAGDSITLHASHNVVIVEPSPVPARNKQAIARAHRRGQAHPVIARFLLLPGTLDARLMAIVARKTRDIAYAMGDAPEPSPNDEARLAFPDTI